MTDDGSSITSDEVDALGQLDAVERALALVEDGDTVHSTATISQRYSTDVSDLWDAITTADRLARWFGEVTGDLRVGGHYQVTGNASGTIRTCDAPHSFTATWEMFGAVTTITVTVRAEDDGARLTLQHTGAVPAEIWSRFGPGGTGIGWDLGMLGLAHHLRTGGDTPAEQTAWGRSDDAKAFMAGSSRRWADVAIAAGTAEADARAAEERTTAFFTGAEQL